MCSCLKGLVLRNALTSFMVRPHMTIMPCFSVRIPEPMSAEQAVNDHRRSAVLSEKVVEGIRVKIVAEHMRHSILHSPTTGIRLSRQYTIVRRERSSEPSSGRVVWKFTVNQPRKGNRVS